MIALFGIAILPFVISREQAHRDKRIKEIASRAVVDPDAVCQVSRIERTTCQRRKNSEFDCAQ